MKRASVPLLVAVLLLSETVAQTIAQTLSPADQNDETVNNAQEIVQSCDDVDLVAVSAGQVRRGRESESKLKWSNQLFDS
jgi:hypothetical protein